MDWHAGQKANLDPIMDDEPKVTRPGLGKARDSTGLSLPTSHFCDKDNISPELLSDASLKMTVGTPGKMHSHNKSRTPPNPGASQSGRFGLDISVGGSSKNILINS